MTRLGIATVGLSETLEDKLADFEPTGEVESGVGLHRLAQEERA
jgi:hypothetical protein